MGKKIPDLQFWLLWCTIIGTMNPERSFQYNKGNTMRIQTTAEIPFEEPTEVQIRDRGIVKAGITHVLDSHGEIKPGLKEYVMKQGKESYDEERAKHNEARARMASLSLHIDSEESQ